MLRIAMSILFLAFSALVQAKENSSFYQVDLIIFIHQQASTLPAELSLSATLSSANNHAIPIQTETSKKLTPYHLLPFYSSQLREEYWALHRKMEYQMLLNYSWLQPLNNQRAITLPKINRHGWQLEGSIRIQRSNYYLLTTELLFSPPQNNQSPFVFAQKQRLKGGDTYYFDHPQAGILIKIHQLR